MPRRTSQRYPTCPRHLLRITSGKDRQEAHVACLWPLPKKSKRSRQNSLGHCLTSDYRRC
ncbi:hypothetical protein C8T65DRAFT_644062 [Cerioporus squamosus]|nr:hypothetical protein C8T65DRAFT_644062 [Cerioporus squamosus]